jgi:hypothetical protein
MQIKTTVGFYLNPVTMTIIQKTHTHKKWWQVCREGRKEELSNAGGGNVN